MSFAGLLRHEATILRDVAVLDGSDLPTYNERGQPIVERVTIGTWLCRVEPIREREVGVASGAGPVLSTHTIYGLPTDLRPADVLQVGTDLYEITGIKDGGGAGHHLEVDATLTTSAEPALP